ncbi:MAG: Crp/Fnr family transcriptional regulator [Sphingomicrobium sp.]
MDLQTAANRLDPLVDKLQQWTTLTPDERAAVLSLPCKVEGAKAGKYIVREGDRPIHSCLLIEGFAFRQKLVADGGRSISAIHMRGDVVDLQNSLLGVADHSVQALNNCTLGFIPREAIREIAFALPNVGMAMWYDTLVDGSIFREWIANITRRNAAARIAHLICEFGVRLEAAGLGQKLNYELPMTQEQLADCTGLTPVHVNRTLKALQLNGDITRSVRHVAIADWAKISATADFRSTYLHLGADESAPSFANFGATPRQFSVSRSSTSSR